MKILVIPDVHLKPRIFERAAGLLNAGAARRAVCLMDIPDDWGQELNLDLYKKTFDAAIRFQQAFPDTLWCYGNHDLSYLWLRDETGFSPLAINTVNEKLRKLREALPDDSQLAYIHRIDNVLFLHGGLTHAFVKYYAREETGDGSLSPNDETDAVLAKINSLGRGEMWDDASPIWYRPQFYGEKMYRESDLLQVVGHTPVERIERSGNVLSCDLFSTYRSGAPIGTEEFVVIETETWEYRGVK